MGVIIHHDHQHRSEVIVHEGKEYTQLGEPGQLGHGVFNLPKDVADFFLKFPGWKSGEPAGSPSIVVHAPPVVDQAEEAAKGDDAKGNAAGTKAAAGK